MHFLALFIFSVPSSSWSPPSSPNHNHSTTCLPNRINPRHHRPRIKHHIHGQHHPLTTPHYPTTPSSPPSALPTKPPSPTTPPKKTPSPGSSPNSPPTAPSHRTPAPWIHDSLPPHLQRKRILDIGSGTGRPVCSSLAEASHSVLGIDLCPAMVEFARKNVASLYPDGRAEFVEADVRTFEPERDGPFFRARAEALKAKGESWNDEDPQGYYHAVTAYFSLIAAIETQKEIKEVIQKVYHWLTEGGLFVFGTAPMDVQGEVIEWMGNPILVSSLSRSQILEAIREVGFEIEWEVTSKFAPKAVEAGILKPEEAEKAFEEEHLFVCAVKRWYSEE